MTTVDSGNVDAEEIAKFEALASRWWDPHSEFKPLHDLNPLRLNYIDERADLHGKSVLDIGCGGGILAESMAWRGARVLGIDMGDAPLRVAELHALETGAEISYQKISAEQMAAENPGSFDVVTCLEMLEHVPNPDSIMAACATLVKPGGKVFFSTINRNVKSYLYAIVGAEYLLNLLPRGTHQHQRFIKPSELGKAIRENGLTLQELSGISYNPIQKSYKLDRDPAVNYIAYASKPSDVH